MQGDFGSLIKGLPPVIQRVLAGGVTLFIAGSLVGAVAAPKYKIPYWQILAISFPMGCAAGYACYWGEGRSFKFGVDPREAKGAYKAAVQMSLAHLSNQLPGTEGFNEVLAGTNELLGHARILQSELQATEGGDFFVSPMGGVFPATRTADEESKEGSSRDPSPVLPPEFAEDVWNDGLSGSSQDSESEVNQVDEFLSNLPPLGGSASSLDFIGRQ